MYFEFFGGKRDLKNVVKFVLSITRKNVKNKTKIKSNKKVQTAQTTLTQVFTTVPAATSHHFARDWISFKYQEKFWTNHFTTTSIFIDWKVVAILWFIAFQMYGTTTCHCWSLSKNQIKLVQIDETIHEIWSIITGTIDQIKNIKNKIIQINKNKTQRGLGILYFSK